MLVEKFRRPNRRTIDMFSLLTSLSSVYNPSQRSAKSKYNEFEKESTKQEQVLIGTIIEKLLLLGIPALLGHSRSDSGLVRHLEL